MDHNDAILIYLDMILKHVAVRIYSYMMNVLMMEHYNLYAYMNITDLNMDVPMHIY